MEIKAKCKHDLDSIKALVRLTMFKKEDPKKRMIMWSVIYGILYAVLIFEMIAFGVDKFLIFTLSVCVLFRILMWFWYLFFPRIQYKSLSKMKDAENQYVFYDDSLKVSTITEEYDGESEIKYSLFTRVFETSVYLFLCQTNNSILIVKKSTVENGTVEEIRSKLLYYMKDKYIICKY